MCVLDWWSISFLLLSLHSLFLRDAFSNGFGFCCSWNRGRILGNLCGHGRDVFDFVFLMRVGDKEAPTESAIN